MSSPFVRPQHMSLNNGGFATATMAGRLYGMDVEVGSENVDLEQMELGGIGELDADVPAEVPSAEAHDARVKSSTAQPTAST